MGKTLATLITINTYGTWLRGDMRGWVDDGTVYPPDPVLEELDWERTKHLPYKFPRHTRHGVGQAIGESLHQRMELRIFAMCVQSWHSHIVIAPTNHPVADVVKCAKDAARWHLRLGRPIWAVGYDERFCFERRSAKNRVQYVEKHNLADGLPARPWEFIEDLGF